MSEEGQPGESERRERLNYWVRRAYTSKGMSQAEFARAIGAPASTVNRWFSPTEKAEPGITWLGRICAALKLDPMLFAKLPVIPEDPLQTFALDDASDLLTVIDAARLAQLDPAPGEEARLPAEAEPSAPPRKRQRRDGLKCSPGRSGR